MDVKYVLFNTVKQLLVTQEEIKFKTKFDKLINQTKKELMNQKVKTDNIFSRWNGILRTGGHTRSFNKKNFERFPYRAPGNE